MLISSYVFLYDRIITYPICFQSDDMKKKQTTLWRTFYEHDKEMLANIKANTTSVITKDSAFSYQTYTTILGEIRERAPKYIRYLGTTTNKKSYQTLCDMAAVVERKYWDAMEEMYEGNIPEDARLPLRFPQFYSNVDCGLQTVRIDESEAYRSRKLLPSGTFRIASHLEKHLNYARDDMETLRKNGLSSSAIEHDVFFGQYHVTVSAEEFYRWSKATGHIQIRTHSGTQYRVTMYDDEFNETRATLGLIVVLLDEDRDIEVYTARKRKPRSDSLSMSGDRIELPIRSESEFYRR